MRLANVRPAIRRAELRKCLPVAILSVLAFFTKQHNTRFRCSIGLDGYPKTEVHSPVLTLPALIPPLQETLQIETYFASRYSSD